MEIQCHLGHFDGCNAGPDSPSAMPRRQMPAAPCGEPNGGLAHTQTEKRLLPERASSSFVPPGPTSVCPTSPRIPRSTSKQHTDDIIPHRSTATRYDLDATGPGAGKRMKDDGTR